jgi:hypothetical protein
MEEGSVTMLDLRVAVGVCRLSFGNSRIRKPWLIPSWLRIKMVLLAFRKPAKAPLDPKADQPLSPAQKVLQGPLDEFQEYLGDYCQNPEFAVIPRGGTNQDPKTPRGRFPEEFEIVADLISYFHGAVPLNQIWDMPIGQANFYRTAALRAAGADVDVTTVEEKAFQDSLPDEFRWNLNGHS